MRIFAHTASAAVRRTLDSIIAASGHHLTNNAADADCVLYDRLHPAKTKVTCNVSLELVAAPVTNDSALACPLRPHALIQRLMTLGNTQTVTLGNGWSLDMQARTLTRNESSLTLTEKECALLKHLVQAYPKALLRDDLLEQVWGMSTDVDSHTLETHIYRLRAKLQPLLPNPCDIRTENGAYLLALGGETR